MVEREAYDLLFGQRKAPNGTPLGRAPGGGRKAADLYAVAHWLQHTSRDGDIQLHVHSRRCGTTAAGDTRVRVRATRVIPARCPARSR
jgi:hypothetical protein